MNLLALLIGIAVGIALCALHATVVSLLRSKPRSMARDLGGVYCDPEIREPESLLSRLRAHGGL